MFELNSSSDPEIHISSSEKLHVEEPPIVEKSSVELFTEESTIQEKESLTTRIYNFMTSYNTTNAISVIVGVLVFLIPMIKIYFRK
ncbi:hypothetical protein GUI12_00495 [Anaplasmataceae bacterium AB001_6]|nr:hypothetical protein GUI12_00495 [Anaplasmataceae bacterium AB001_6]